MDRMHGPNDWTEWTTLLEWNGEWNGMEWKMRGREHVDARTPPSRVIIQPSHRLAAALLQRHHSPEDAKLRADV